jgi:hypothetical protein
MVAYKLLSLGLGDLLGQAFEGYDGKVQCCCVFGLHV